MIEPWVYPALTAVAVLTGFIDAIAGGGGLIMMPALLFTGMPPLQALGTNKLQSMFGTMVAMSNYGRTGLIEWRRNMPTVLVVFAGAALGCWVVQQVETRVLQLIIPLFLLGVGGQFAAGHRLPHQLVAHRLLVRTQGMLQRLGDLRVAGGLGHEVRDDL